jgi:NAD(P)H-nitrite reductase large subunit
LTDPDDEEDFEILEEQTPEEPAYRKIVLRDDRIVGAIFIGRVDRAGIITGLARQQLDVSEFKDELLTEGFGLISLPPEYRRNVVSGHHMDV